MSVNWHIPLMISVKKNWWTALSKALGPFLYGFNSCPWASYSRGCDGAWLARSLIPLLREGEREECSAWEQVEFDIRQRETRGERENEWRAAKAIRGCKPTTRLDLEYMVSDEVERTGSHVHVVRWQRLTGQSNSSKIKDLNVWTAMSSTTAKAKAKTKVPPLSDQGMYLALISEISLWTRSARDSAKLYSIAKWTTSSCKENRWTWVRSRRTYVRLFHNTYSPVFLTDAACIVWSFLH